MVELKNLDVMLDDKQILRSIQFVWKKGENIALLGANGAGKSTFLKVLATLIKPDSGKMILPDSMSRSEWRKKVGVVFPETFLYDAMTAMENLDFYARLYQCHDHKRIEEMLSWVGLWEVRNEQAGTFSKGMKQRLSLGRSLIHNPEYLLLDEPFDGLDVESVAVIDKLFMQLKRDGVGWILVSHNIQQAWAYCDRAVLLHKGRLYKELACNELTYESFQTEFRQILKESYGHAIP